MSVFSQPNVFNPRLSAQIRGRFCTKGLDSRASRNSRLKFLICAHLRNLRLIFFPEHPLENLVHVPQLPLNRKCLLNLLRRDP